MKILDWFFVGLMIGVTIITAWLGWIVMTIPYVAPPPDEVTYTKAQLDAEYRAGLTEGAKRATLDAQRCQCGYRQFLGEICKTIP